MKKLFTQAEVNKLIAAERRKHRKPGFENGHMIGAVQATVQLHEDDQGIYITVGSPQGKVASIELNMLEGDEIAQTFLDWAIPQLQ